ncbi:MAG: hypothetical protein QOE61_2434, partial [Micromonosporaceae bacterium]|nr:hypothetical protein [Micromonosporaceae bacterium]
MSTSIVAQRSGPLGARVTGRFTPTRAGVINLWDYRDEEFSFAQGWLVLRGPNGSGKTKALEVLFPFVLDGRIEPRRLNPFASEERTMKSNLLYRGQESAYSYVWLEFGNGVEHVTVGVGLRAQRHNDRVTRWYFVADGRVGVDFSLIDAEDRPVVRKQLAAQLGAGAVRDNAEEHRAAVDTRLFGLGPERYEQLLNLVLTLRRPQLAKNLDPARLSDTLTDGLRPIDEDLLAEAARSFDDMEAVQRTLDGLVAADGATRAFLAIYTTYLRTHARSAADAMRRRSQESVERRAALADAHGRHSSALELRRNASAAVLDAEAGPPRLRAHLDRLKTSTAYQSVEQLADLDRLVRELAEAAVRAHADRDARRAQATKRTQELTAARRVAADLDAEAARLARTLAEEADAAGIAWTADDSQSEGFATRVTARVAERRDDLTAVRAAAQRLGHAERDRARASDALERATAAADAADRAEVAAAGEVDRNRAAAREQLTRWAERHAGLLAALGLTELPGDLADALATTGEADATDPRVVFARGTASAIQAVRDERAAVRARTSTIESERAALAAQRSAIAAERDDAPESWRARPAPRDGRPGAPLWRLVRFADDVSDVDAAAIEAALEAANLLDAWVHPDDATTAAALADGEADGFLVPRPGPARPDGRTLADVLVAEDAEEAGAGAREPGRVAASRVRAVLASIALRSSTVDATETVAVSTTGQFAQGVQVGGYAKAAPEFIGATARARRRAARLAECDRLLGELAETLAGLARRDTTLTSSLDAAAAAERDLPGVGAIVEALRIHDRAAAILRTRREGVDAAAALHDAAIAEVGAASLAVARICAERALAAEAVEETAAALGRFELTGDRLGGVRREIATAARAADDAGHRVAEALSSQERAEAAVLETEQRHATEAEQLSTLHAVVGAEAEAVLADIARTETDIGVAERLLVRLRADLLAAEGAVSGADATRAAALTALRTAAVEEQQEARALAPFAHADLLELLRCPAHLRWPAQQSDWPDLDASVALTDGATLPAEVVILHEAILTATRDLTPSESSIKQIDTRVTRALDDLQGELSAAGQDHRPEWTTDAGIIVVTVAGEQGHAPVKHFADRIAADRRDQEALLTESERRILEDTLLSALARQIHQRTIDARDLVEAMDREMRARRMSSGVSIGVGWQLADDLDEDQRAISKLLERNPARLGPDDLARMRRHFAGRIKAARSVR